MYQLTNKFSTKKNLIRHKMKLYSTRVLEERQICIEVLSGRQKNSTDECSRMFSRWMSEGTRILS